YTLRQDSVHEVFKAFKRYSSQSHSSRTHQRFCALLRHFGEFLRTSYPLLENVQMLTPRILEDYRLRLLHQAGQDEMIFTFFMLGELFNFAIRSGAINDDPTFHIREKFIIHSKIQLIMDYKQRALTVEKLDHTPIDIGVRVLIETGARKKHLEDFSQASLSLEGKIRMRAYQNTYGDLVYRELPLSAPLREHLTPLWKEEGALGRFFQNLNQRSLFERFREVLSPEASSIDEVFVINHRSFAASLCQKRVPPLNLQHYLGLNDLIYAYPYFAFYLKMLPLD
ncbi:MAG: hypothetical protein KC713_05470, partial [Candidatus Omnitrophica bacterium]|nr:hypothetical protein [Candidatus Omnitrophota bacterium]